jgi:hypothetical protein
MQVNIARDYDGKDLHLVIQSNSAIGAVPLISPMTARPDFGLVIQPRFPWTGIGPMLAEMGWLIPPTPLKLPLLKRSERRVPPWVLSFMILARFQALLDRLDRRFEMVRDICRAPKGASIGPATPRNTLPAETSCPSPAHSRTSAMIGN